MKFKHINIAAVKNLVPSWACDYMRLARGLDQCIESHAPSQCWDLTKPLPVWFEVDIKDGVRLRLKEPDLAHDLGDAAIGTLGAVVIRHADWRIHLPLNNMLKGYSERGNYSIYCHGLVTETPIGYVGLTSRPWFVRLAEHRSAAGRGSPFLFHEALRRHPTANIVHKVFLAGLDRHSAMQCEEAIVAACSLYPIGLNMIPGGYAGLKYLSTLAVKLDDTEHVAECIATEMTRAPMQGRPNPLCSARWESDPDYAARVICGHSGRLTVEQVHMVRALYVTGREPAEIAVLADARIQQVKRLLSQQTYARVR